MLTVAGGDLRVVAYTAAPGSEAAEKLRLLAVLGPQHLADLPAGWRGPADARGVRGVVATG